MDTSEQDPAILSDIEATKFSFGDLFSMTMDNLGTASRLLMLRVLLIVSLFLACGGLALGLTPYFGSGAKVTTYSIIQLVLGAISALFFLYIEAIRGAGITCVSDAIITGDKSLAKKGGFKLNNRSGKALGSLLLYWLCILLAYSS